jgi:isopropylmalate/homocitrate/citramalate synthase
MKKIVDTGAADPKRTTLYLNGKVVNIVGQLEELKQSVDRIVELGGNGFNPVCFAPILTKEGQESMAAFVHYVRSKYSHFVLNMAFAVSTGGVPFSGKLPHMRASFDWQLELASQLSKLGVNTICIADSIGCCPVTSFKYLTKQFKNAIGDAAGLAVHNHNDFGFAAANAIAGVEAGADWVEVSACGLGARAGNASISRSCLPKFKL